MVLIKLTFPGGRYHATPWGRHVNEGAVEWPPCPWRLLRALIAVYWRKGRHLAEPGEVECLINRLAATPPRYALPNGVAAHTRHYMPLFKEKTTKVFDAFFHIEPGSCVHVAWCDIKLEGGEQFLLAGLLEGLGYLGRAESWSVAELLGPSEDIPELNALPMEDSRAELTRGYERESVLCPMTPVDYAEWREKARSEKEAILLEAELLKAREKLINQKRDPELAKLTIKQKENIGKTLDELFPATLFEAMHTDTGDLHKQGWSAAPGSRRIAYARPPLEAARTLALTPQRRRHDIPVIVRFALASDTAGADVRPRLENALYLGENVRRALMSQSRKLAERRGDPAPQSSPVFSGKNPDGTRLDNEHAHAHILCCDDDGDGRIDHLAIYAPMGFTYDDLTAMSRLRKLWQYGGRPSLLALLVGQGMPADFGGFNTRNEESSVLAEARIWRSMTPYVLTRHPKLDRRGQPKLNAEGCWIDGPEMQLRTELMQRGFPEPECITPYSPSGPLYWRNFVRERKRGDGAQGGRKGHGFCIEFPEPVRGPVVLGYACHFGLGLFSPLRE